MEDCDGESDCSRFARAFPLSSLRIPLQRALVAMLAYTIRRTFGKDWALDTGGEATSAIAGVLCGGTPLTK